MSDPVDVGLGWPERITKLNYPLTEVISLALSVSNIKDKKEVYLAMLGQVAWTWRGYNGPDGSYNVLIGYQSGVGRHNMYVYLPTLLMFYETVQDAAKVPGDFELANVFTYKAITRWSLFAFGYLVGKSRLL